MKTRKTKIRRMVIRMRGYFAPMILLCYPASVLAMFLLVGVLTCDGQSTLQRDKSGKPSTEKITLIR
jgi:hypothetical protein